MQLAVRILFIFGVLLAGACSSGTDNTCTDRSDILASGHSGWRTSDCTPCHDPPVVNHDGNTALSDCAACHGGNGAPVLTDAHPGWKNNTCSTCHASLTDHNDGLTLSECAACHGGNGAPVLADTHTGWKDNNCTPCHAQPIAGHEDTVALPQCAECHGGNGACAPPWVSWHPQKGCSTYNCHGANHGYTNNLDCGKCHFASAGVFQCTVYN